MAVTVETLPTARIHAAIDALAALRIAVFREWPYLYDGDLDYERGYLAEFAAAPDAVLVIAREGDTFVFCEVRLRSGTGFGGAAESITGRKQARIAAAARYFLTARPEAPCRFDVLLLQTLDLARIRWIRNAFTV